MLFCFATSLQQLSCVFRHLGTAVGIVGKAEEAFLIVTEICDEPAIDVLVNDTLGLSGGATLISPVSLLAAAQKKGDAGVKLAFDVGSTTVSQAERSGPWPDARFWEQAR